MSASWLTSAGDEPLELRPELATLYQAFEGRLWQERLVDPELLELCRLRVCSLLGDTVGAAARTPGVTVAPDRIARLPAWPTDPAFTSGERAALAYTEQFVIDPHGLGDDLAASLAAFLDPSEVVAFTTALGLFDGMSRFRVVLGGAPA